MPKNATNGSTEIHGVSAHDNLPILFGQIAHGGVALVWRNRLNDFIKPVKSIDHDGIVAIQCNFSLDCTLFIIAVYLPSTIIVLMNLMKVSTSCGLFMTRCLRKVMCTC